MKYFPECDKDDDHRPQVSRLRRTTEDDFSQSRNQNQNLEENFIQTRKQLLKDKNISEGRIEDIDENISKYRIEDIDEKIRESRIEDLEDRAESRIEGLEENIRESRLEISNLKRKLSRLSRRVVGSRNELGQRRVCVDFDGELRSEGESWIHLTESGEKCAQCQCEVSV
jgi:hypothetical protein